MSNLYLFFTTVLLSFSAGSDLDKNQPVFTDNSVQEETAIATFAGGCFWCTEAVFERMIGVKDVVSGYTGGTKENPTYREVSYGRTRHAEAVQIFYDPEVVSYEELLAVFFKTHDPTQKDGQGNDIGPQYRSAVFYHDEQQKELAAAYMKKIASDYDKPIVTELNELTKFYLAEKYHQNYYELNPGNPYIINVARPKVKKFKKYFPDKVKAKYN